MSRETFNEGLLDFLGRSPTPFHAVESMASLLAAGGFRPLDEKDSWHLERPGNYLVKRDGALIAFRLGDEPLVQDGFHLAGAHTDSPGLKIKPVAERQSQGYLQLGVEVYGGALLNPWFDRDLSIAGKVAYADRTGQWRTCLIDLQRPVAVIPSLAIHLDREVNKSRSIDPQKHLPPVVLQVKDKTQPVSFDDFLLSHLRGMPGSQGASRVLSHELYLYDTQPPALVGLESEFIASARLDNLLSCYLITQSLLACTGRHTSLMVCNDHEEVGSSSASGALGPFLKAVLQRLLGQETGQADALERASRNSLFLSVDNAHGVHPNYPELHDPAHGPALNAGPVIKINANQRYASNAESVARFRTYCDKAGVQTQAFVMRSDLACGSTIGPLTATETGIATVDVGVPTFAMHSIRELAGAADGEQLYRVVTAFFNRD